MWIVAIIALVILFIASCTKREEMFDDGGALMQMAADSVPDEEVKKKYGVSF